MARKRTTALKLDPQALEAFAELGRVGGQTRAKNLTAAARSASARKAAQARWAKRKATAR
jgi:hypothetical protein